MKERNVRDAKGCTNARPEQPKVEAKKADPKKPDTKKPDQKKNPKA